MGINIPALSRPNAELILREKTVYFYAQSNEALKKLQELQSEWDAKRKLQIYLTGVASYELHNSKTCPKPERIVITEIEKWSDEELHKIATLMCSAENAKGFWNFYLERVELPVAPNGQPPIERVAQLLEWRKMRIQKSREDLVKLAKGNSWSSAVDWVDSAKSRQFEELIKMNSAINSSHWRIANDRQNELENLRIIAESSQANVSATVLLSQNFLDFADNFYKALQKQEIEQIRAIKFATKTFLVTLVVAIIGTLFAVASFRQDYENNRSNDDWQSRVEGIFKRQVEGADATKALQKEVDRLAAEVEMLRTHQVKKPKQSSNLKSLSP